MVEYHVYLYYLLSCLQFYRVMYKFENRVNEIFRFTLRQTLTDKELKIICKLRRKQNVLTEHIY
jgi:hypothetical protein